MTITPIEPTEAPGAFDQHDAQIVQYLGLNPANPAHRAAVAVARTYNLDPVLKHVIVIPKGGVYITRDGLLHVAHRSGQLDGIVVEQDPTLIDGEWVAKVTVHRKDMRHGFTYVGRYPANGSNKQYAPEMAMKAAEAHALRRAFDVTGIPAIDEQRPPTEHHEPQNARERLRAAAEATLPDVTDAEIVEAETDIEIIEGQAELPVAAHITPKQSKRLHALCNDLGLDRDAKLAGIAKIIGRDVESSNDLTPDEASEVIDSLVQALEARQAEADA